MPQLAPPGLSIVCFRYVPADLRGDDEDLNAVNKRVIEEVQASGPAFLTQTTLRRHLALRGCILHYATTEADVASLVDVVRQTSARLAIER